MHTKNINKNNGKSEKGKQTKIKPIVKNRTIKVHTSYSIE